MPPAWPVPASLAVSPLPLLPYSSSPPNYGAGQERWGQGGCSMRNIPGAQTHPEWLLEAQEKCGPTRHQQLFIIHTLQCLFFFFFWPPLGVIAGTQCLQCLLYHSQQTCFCFFFLKFILFKFMAETERSVEKEREGERKTFATVFQQP